MIFQALLNKILIVFICFMAVVMTLLFFIFGKGFDFRDINCFTKTKNIDIKKEPLVGGSLFLSLNSEMENSFSSIIDQIEVFCFESRPDSCLKKIKFKSKFKFSNNIRNICEDEKVFIKVNENNNFDFSDKETPFFMKLRSVDLTHVKVVLEADLQNFDERDEKKIESFSIALMELPFNDFEVKREMKALASSKWWNIDQFLKIYNADDEKANKQRLEIDNEILYFDKKDLLIFKQNKWQIAKKTDETSNYSLAKLKNLNSNLIEIEAWDLSGENKFVFEIPLEGKQSSFPRFDQVISSVRKRTQTHISCLVDKQRMILKEKDLFLKKESRWKVLKKNIDFDEIKNEEIFYFEKIENKNSTQYLIGYFFNPMRTSFQKIEIPITSFSNQRQLKKR